jgi:hypothetical protein
MGTKGADGHNGIWQHHFFLALPERLFQGSKIKQLDSHDFLSPGGRHETHNLGGMLAEFVFERLASDAVEQRLFQLTVAAAVA